MDETISTTPATEVTTEAATEPITEPAPAETSAETFPEETFDDSSWETIDTTTETEYIPLEDYYSEPATEPILTEPVPSETITITDYTPIIVDTGNNICSCVLFGCLAICGVLCAIRLWGVRSS